MATIKYVGYKLFIDLRLFVNLFCRLSLKAEARLQLSISVNKNRCKKVSNLDIKQEIFVVLSCSFSFCLPSYLAALHHVHQKDNCSHGHTCFSRL